MPLFRPFVHVESLLSVDEELKPRGGAPARTAAEGGGGYWKGAWLVIGLLDLLNAVSALIEATVTELLVRQSENEQDEGEVQ